MLFYHVNGYYWLSKRVWKKVESQEKVSEKSGNFDTDNEWQPCIITYYLVFNNNKATLSHYVSTLPTSDTNFALVSE